MPPPRIRRASRTPEVPTAIHPFASLIYAERTSVILEQHANALPVMHPPNGFREHTPDLQHLELGTQPHMLVLRHTVGDDDFVEVGAVDALAGIAGEDAVGDEGVDAAGAGFLEQLGGAGDGVGGVCEIVDEDGGAVDYGADEEEGCGLAGGGLGWATFLSYITIKDDL